MRRSNTVVALMGPTASGKTDAAIELASLRDIDIISVDSAMIYRGMDIGTAKPPADVLEKCPHALVDIRDPWEPYSAQDFVVDADRAIRTAWSSGRIPMLVGGTMLYFKAFKNGLAELPSGDPDVRRDLNDRAEAHGWPYLHRELTRVDPIAAARIDPNNRQRIQRALEVYEISGTPISVFWAETDKRSAAKRLNCAYLEFAISELPRAMLHERIEKRLDAMLGGGLVNEVEGLKSNVALDPAMPAMRAVGYRQIWEYLEVGDDSAGARRELRLRILAATRQLAKKQVTWLRSWEGLAGRLGGVGDAVAADARHAPGDDPGDDPGNGPLGPLDAVLGGLSRMLQILKSLP